MSKTRTFNTAAWNAVCNVGDTDLETRTFTNTGTEMLTVTNVDIDGVGFSVDYVGDLPIQLGQSDTLDFDLTFHPETYKDITGSLAVTTTYSATADSIVLNGEVNSNLGLYCLDGEHTKDYVVLQDEDNYTPDGDISGCFSSHAGTNWDYDSDTATFVEQAGDYGSIDILTAPLKDTPLDVSAMLKTVDFLDDNDIKNRSTLDRIWLKTDIRNNTMDARLYDGFSTVESTAMLTFNMYQVDEEVNESVDVSRYCGIKEALIHEIPTASGTMKGVSLQLNMKNEGIINGVNFKVVDPQKGGSY